MELTSEQIKTKVDLCRRQINLKQFSYIKEYLNKRLITDELIDYFELGYGEFFGKRWITIPVKSVNGEYLFIKLRRDPKDKDNKNKFMFYPVGSSGTIYGSEEFLNSKDGTIVCVEGEMDRMILHPMGVSAITSTLGAMSFKKEWIFAFKNCKKVFICFDRDEAGEKGAKRLGEMILEEHPQVMVFQCILPEEVGEHGDVTDFFLKTSGNIDELLYERSVRMVPKKRKEEVHRKYSQDNTNSEITEEDILRARSHNCKDFLRVARSSYNTSWAHCPLGGDGHDKGTPSMCLYEGDKGFYCYSCGVGGDCIDLVMRTNKVSFVEAVKFINKK